MDGSGCLGGRETKMNYPEAIDYLQKLTKFGYNFGLERIAELLRRFSNPHLKMKIIHVGGTNGKGSTSAMMDSILRESGCKVGLYTSPHLHSYNERFRLNGETIQKQVLADLITELRPHLDDMVNHGFEHPTEFEVGTALAFIYFFREKVDFLVLEVGLGGAIDSTNVVVPVLSIITNVAMDHMEYLGNTIEEIAAVKAGIIKKEVPLITAATGEALKVILQKCRELSAPATVVGKDIQWRELRHGLDGQFIEVDGRKGKYKDLYIPLLGRHQQVNASTAVAAVEVLMEMNIIPSDQAIQSGLASTFWPARMEIVNRKPMVIIDAAHNYDGALALRRTLEEYFPGKRVVLILGMLGDKERTRVVSELAPMAAVVIVTKPNSPRAGDWQLLAEEVRKQGKPVETIESIDEAVKAGLASAGSNDLVVITGSFYMVAQARESFL